MCDKTNLFFKFDSRSFTYIDSHATTVNWKKKVIIYILKTMVNIRKQIMPGKSMLNHFCCFTKT